ncbi:MAG: GNAT family N-acetyltransferase [Chloroflexota bacterium]|nr:GNAT family N-acetyltransferase [Chloroflexota bacterium]
MSTTIERLTKPDLPEAAAVLAAALHDEPGFVSVIPDPRLRGDVMGALFQILVRDAFPLGNVWVAKGDGQIVGTAVWYAPGDFPMTLLRQLRLVPVMLPLLRYGRGMVSNLGRMEGNAKAAFPKEPCWYLAALGVDPDRQGQGVGSHLMGAALAEIDGGNGAAYLETGEAINVRFYERFGFEVRESALQLAPPPGPTHWTMWRPPAGS